MALNFFVKLIFWPVDLVPYYLLVRHCRHLQTCWKYFPFQTCFLSWCLTTYWHIIVVTFKRVKNIFRFRLASCRIKKRNSLSIDYNTVTYHTQPAYRHLSSLSPWLSLYMSLLFLKIRSSACFLLRMEDLIFIPTWQHSEFLLALHSQKQQASHIIASATFFVISLSLAIAHGLILERVNSTWSCENGTWSIIKYSKLVSMK